MSADVKTSIKQQEIKDLVAHLTNFYTRLTFKKTYLNRKNPLRGGIHTQVATLNVNMTLESEIPTPLSLTPSVATNIPSFRRKTKK